ncbi:MAG: hypothetical protein MJ249_03630 [Kiritimatiellae bacterium]|nr:hypothetical protein [Kiritimatiellia bacterium]
MNEVGKKKEQFLVTMRRAFRRPLVELFILSVFIGGFVRYGATKSTNGLGGRMALPPPAAALSPSETDVPGTSLPENFPAVTNLCFWEITPGAVSVTLGLAWPENQTIYGRRIDIFGSWDLKSHDWRRICEVDVSGASSNAVVEVARADFPNNAMETIAFFRAASKEDSDGDGLTDAEERMVTHTSPSAGDTDHDGDDDAWEVVHGFDPCSEDVGIRPYGGGSPSGGGASGDGTPGGVQGTATNPVRYGFFGFETTFGGPEAGYMGVDWPPAVSADGLPGLPPDGTHPNATFLVSLSSRGWFRPSVTSNYVFSVAADDNASFSVGGGGASVTWDEDRGAAREFSVDLVGGVCYPVAVEWNTIGGPYFLSLGGGAGTPPEEEAYSPRVRANPHLVTFKAARGVDLRGLAATATIVGECDPEKSYEITVEAGEGLAASDASAYPVDADGFWSDGRSSVAVFRLMADGEEISSDSCVFVAQPVKDDGKCGCCREGTTAENGCVMFSQSFGSTPGHGGLPTGRVVVRVSRLCDSLYTPAALRYDHPMMRRMVYRRNLDAVVVDGLGEAVEYRQGFPSGVSSGSGGQLFRDGNGSFVEELPDGLRVVYDESGNVAALQPRFGDPVPVSDLGIVVSADSQGTIASIASVADGTLRTSTPDAVSSAGYCWRLSWTSPANMAVKHFDFGGSKNASTFTLHEYRSEQFQFDYRWTYDDALQDFVFEKGVGTAVVLREEKSLAYDPVGRVWRSVLTHRDSVGNVLSSSSALLDRNGHALHAVERRDAVSGRLLYSAAMAPNGRVASETDELGRRTEFVYDAFGRVVRETTTAAGVPTTVVEQVYPAGVSPIDFRPARRRTVVGGLTMLDETFSYGMTDAGRRTATHVRTCNGVSRTRYEEYDAQARPVLVVDEDGRTTSTAYSPPDGDGTVVETEDEGVWNDGFETVPGKSVREVRFRNAAGDVVRRERHARIGDDWHLLSWSTHAYNASHKEVQATDSDGTASAADWICPGPVWQTDRGGVTVDNSYNAAKLLSSSTRHGAFGDVTTQYIRDAEGRVVREVRSAEGCEVQTTERIYDSRGRVVSETAPDGAATLTAYSADGRTVTTTFVDGGTRVESLNADGSTASVTGTAVTPVYTARGVSAIQRNGETVNCRWTTERVGAADSPRFRTVYVDGFGETVRVETAGFGNAVNVQDRFYDTKGRLIRQTETDLPTKEYAYDAWGDRVGETASAGNETRTTATARAFVLEDGAVFESTTTTRTCSDPAIAPLVENRRIRRSGLTLAENACVVATDVRGNATVVRMAVDPARQGRVETVQRPETSNIATNWYVDGAIVSNVSHAGVCEQRRLDAYRRETARIDGRGNTTTRSYNPQGRLARVVDASGAGTGYAYDAMGRVVEVTNALDQVSTRAYDLRGNLVAEGGAVYPVNYGYDVYGDRVSLTTFRDASTQPGDTTTWTRDPATGLVTAKTYADGHGPAYAYDVQGRLASRTWARGVVTTYAYDAWGKLTLTAYSDGTPSVTFAYDALGRKTSVSDAAGTTTFAYDECGEVASETWGGLGGRVLARHRDAFGRDAGYSVNGGRKTAVGYDAATGRIATMDAGGVFSWQYLQGTDLKSKVVYPNGVNVDYSYEQHRNLLTGVRNHLGETDFSVYAYTNDEKGQRVSKNDEQYGYNVRGELVSATGNGSYAYQYDDIGNRRTSAECGVQSAEYVANNLNQYTSIEQSEQSNNFSPAYDLDGNQTLVKTATGVWQVTYNGENRPVRWVRASTVVTMDFDSMGRRTFYRETENGTEVSSSRFFYDGYLMIQQLDFETPNAVQKEFIWDPTEPVATKPFVFRQNGMDSAYLTHDGNKNVADVIRAVPYNDSVGHYEYAPFGAVTSSMGSRTMDNPFRFSSEYADDTLGLDYYNYRHYEPGAGRWIGRDLLDEDGCFNLYCFIGNNVAVEIDSLGKSVWSGIVNNRATRLSLVYEGIEGILGAAELARGYFLMRSANVQQSDKWFHCVYMCRASRHSVGIATLIALLREGADLSVWKLKDVLGMTNVSNDTFQRQLLDSLDDMMANIQGIECPRNRTCEDCCGCYKVKGL